MLISQFVQNPSCISGLGCYQILRLLCGVGQTQHFSAAEIPRRYCTIHGQNSYFSCHPRCQRQWSIVFKLWSTPKLGEKSRPEETSSSSSLIARNWRGRERRRKRGLNWGSHRRMGMVSAHSESDHLEFMQFQTLIEERELE